MEKIQTFDQFCEEIERLAWDSEHVFKPVSEWHEDDGDALFFKLHAGEPPVVTSPNSMNWDGKYFTHWMSMPAEFTTGYRMACIMSGIELDHT